MIPQKLYPHLPERSYGEHIIEICEVFIKNGKMPVGKYEPDRYEINSYRKKKLEEQLEAKGDDKKYFFTPYNIATTKDDVVGGYDKLSFLKLK